MKIKWPKPTHGHPESVGVLRGDLKPYRTASECIDWSAPVVSIFERKKPLVDATLNRIGNGLFKHVFNNDNPYIVDSYAPLLTECANASSPRCMPADEPLRTQTAVKGGHFAAIIPKLRSMDNNIVLTEAEIRRKHLCSAFLSIYYGSDKYGQSLENPLRTILSKAKFGLVVVNHKHYEIIDIGFRMLSPKELYKAQGFPESYIFDKGIDYDDKIIKLTITDQTRMVGNSVCPDLAEAIISCNMLHEKAWTKVA